MPILEADRPAARVRVLEYDGTNTAEVAEFARQEPGGIPGGTLTLETGDESPAFLPVGWLVTELLTGPRAGRIGVISAAHYATWGE